MSVLIKGIALPEVYGPAILTVYECKNGQAIPREYKLSATQMQSIPPHGPLIDAEEVIEVQMIDEMYEEWTLKTMTVGEYLAFASDVPTTIIEAEEGEEA